ncbi:hypothetical protein GCM10022284_10690 [Streptomyces hundungensis]
MADTEPEGQRRSSQSSSTALLITTRMDGFAGARLVRGRVLSPSRVSDFSPVDFSPVDADLALLLSEVRSAVVSEAVSEAMRYSFRCCCGCCLRWCFSGTGTAIPDVHVVAACPPSHLICLVPGAEYVGWVYACVADARVPRESPATAAPKGRQDYCCL